MLFVKRYCGLNIYYQREEQTAKGVKVRGQALNTAIRPLDGIAQLVFLHYASQLCLA